ncbi:3-hydroxyacyl-CoA dehydrogenase [Roseiconus lacunae]|uniref:3-hydroxyacyl-CoA dehydrogenase NAD-binding domain-containing protein n=1 Tax=Roseiconus lacunae TaxID=2605694 RepID=A0ABT7PDU9_9BACT|nr:3-hydroxyacyl-CoA dehydrogenase [Roseiconus lacunae]MDM4014669.1 3-hydroxyacyl-CoA dehydrogenase NAD-binding domain-containing protein [Roseiconus lacunae]
MPTWPDSRPKTLLIGAGVVGVAIAEAHFAAKRAFCLGDANASSLEQAANYFSQHGGNVESLPELLDGLHLIAVSPPLREGEAEPEPLPSLMVIESVNEQLAVKQDLLGKLSRVLQNDAILCSNTSTLRIDEIAAGREVDAHRLCGMHFFMPVHQRAGVEIVAGGGTDAEVLEQAVEYAGAIHKRAIRCKDGPGFIVNRMLSPYLNQALLLLCRGATAEQIERVAVAYGMPLSPLELIDWIGATTMFHAGRAYINAFPQRVDPSPMIPGLLKRKRLGRASGCGLYDYDRGERSQNLSDAAAELVETYRTANHDYSDGDVLRLLAIPMWIEAQQILNDQIAESMEQIDAAMVGGLGFNSHERWSSIFEEIGENEIDAAMAVFGDQFAAMRAPETKKPGR